MVATTSSSFLDPSRVAQRLFGAPISFPLFCGCFSALRGAVRTKIQWEKLAWVASIHVALDLDDHLFDQRAEQLLPVARRGCGRSPDGCEIGAEPAQAT
jgi:hypothetical protein